MSLRFLKLTFLYVLLSFSSQIDAQVTIGSDLNPSGGSLLDLKQNSDGSSTKGLMLPRVKLLDPTKLQMGTAPELTGAERASHTGLVVFNVNENSPFCKGLYVWDSEQWQRLSADLCIDLNVSPVGPLYFSSGQNGSTITPANVNISWFPTEGTVTWASTGINFTTTPSAPWTTTPLNNIKFTPAAMTAQEVSDTGGNPFLTKTGEITFTLNDNGKTKIQKIDVNQTNRAITVNGSLNPPLIENPTASTGNTATVRSNSSWQLAEIVPATQSAFQNISIAQGVKQGSDKNDGTFDTKSVTYNIQTGSGISRYSSLVFSDTETPKRFTDVTLSILQCSNTDINISMSQWATIAGFPNVPKDKVSDADDQSKGIDTPNPTTGIAWHRDQDGNIFLSSNFDATNPAGNNERWMITNLAATKYAAGVTHQAGSSLTGPNNNSGNSTTMPYWHYPNLSVNLYNNNPRIGVMYTWNAATAGKSSTTTANEGGSNAYARVQGVCPNGWHLPSDYEFTVLENQIIYRTKTYSDTENISTNASLLAQSNTSGLRGTLHGKAMKEECEPYTSTNQGTSNPISTNIRSGFNAFLTGSIGSGTTGNYNKTGFFWTSSSASSTQAWDRSVSEQNSQVNKDLDGRYFLLSVRCKKD